MIMREDQYIMTVYTALLIYNTMFKEEYESMCSQGGYQT